LFLIISIPAFANLGVSYGEIMSGVGFNNYFDMQYRPLNDGTPRYIGKYSIITLEIIGNKNNPRNTTFLYQLIDDFETMSMVSIIIQNWMRNTMVHSFEKAYNWLITVYENNPNTTSREVSKKFNDYLITTIWKGGLMMIDIKRPGYKETPINKPDENSYSNDNYKETSNRNKEIYSFKINSENGGYIRINDGVWTDKENMYVNRGKEITLYAKPRKGYTFKGWYRNNSYITDKNPYKRSITGYTKMEAKFSHLGEIKVLDDDCKLNEEIQIMIVGEDIPSTMSMDLYIIYDEKYLKPTENSFVSLGEELKNYRIFEVDKRHPGKIKISIGKIDGNLSSVKSGKIITINMVSKDILGKTTLDIASDSQIIGSDYRDMDLVFKSGTIFIRE